jgi:hypothetical protein
VRWGSQPVLTPRMIYVYPRGPSTRQTCVLIADEDEDHLRRHGWRTRERHGHGVLSPYVDELAGVLFFETWIGDKIGMPYTAQGW